MMLSTRVPPIGTADCSRIWPHMLSRWTLLVGFLLSLALPALAQTLVYPVDVAVDPDGAVFVADHEAHALLKLEGGSFKTVAKGQGRPRTPLYGIRHIARAKDGKWVASDPATMKLYTIDGAGTVEPVADDERFVTPWGIAVEPSGGILAVDRVTPRLRGGGAGGRGGIFLEKDGAIVVLTDKTLVRVSGSSTTPIVATPPFEFPHDAVLHPNGNYYVTDRYTHAVWQVAPDGKVTALVKGDPLKSPQGIAVDAKGSLLVADAHAKTIFQVTL